LIGMLPTNYHRMLMTIQRLTKQELRHAQKRVPEFVRRAQALLVAGFEKKLGVASVLGANALDHCRAEKLEAVRIYPAPAGGYHADLIFAGLPPGMSDTIGTATNCPKPTRAAAEDMAVQLLATLLIHQSGRTLQPPMLEQRIFLFHGLDFRLPIEDVMPEVRACSLDLELAIRSRLNSFVADHLGDKVTVGSLEQLPVAHRKELHKLMCSALGAGIIRHPAPVHRVPSGPPTSSLH
jgi:hypothetical protein